MTIRFDIRELDEVTSTNDVVKQLASEGEPEGIVVCARSQTAGYGRRGNQWKSEPGSLYMSLLLRPKSETAQIQTLPLVVALAVRRAIVPFLPSGLNDAVQVKWPNDVVLADEGDAFSKLCGISSELKHGAICVGIGVNVHSADVTPVPGTSVTFSEVAGAKRESNEVLRNKPTYISEFFESADVCPSVEQVRDAVLAQFVGIYERWQDFGFAPFRDEYLRHAALLGQTVRVEDALAFVGEEEAPTREVPCCIIKGIDIEGRLVASLCDSGKPVSITAGRVQVLHG